MSGPGSEAAPTCKRMVLRCCLVENYDDVIEAHQLMKPAGKFLEQTLQIAMRGNCLRDGKQGGVRARRRPLPAHHPESLSWRMP